MKDKNHFTGHDSATFLYGLHIRGKKGYDVYGFRRIESDFIFLSASIKISSVFLTLPKERGQDSSNFKFTSLIIKHHLTQTRLLASTQSDYVHLSTFIFYHSLFIPNKINQYETFIQTDL